ncbi:MAG: ribosome maturation factor RimP [Corynebacterium sp.]|uniref:ribosome maturation factor RimP n=1 Tax=unclassified Corynebacterium TaxID=2624378 RepID=UPI0026483675|nr:ribosome maturation factor RimP [Corynebacterium sp.]MDN5582757.1 ribosome maturation factor RimP [Corynebacterium sp.]MDN5721271.1 ribosome maturation factor RimP [Corynebacterium sp.]MDN6387730.1 ribosome maturation factor RimP [Corynebacterium sp.]MDN6511152.1 ribosome maturation factor RimP [Corynebacterium sp.]
MAFPSEQDLAEVISPLAAQLGLDLESITVTRAGAKSAVRVAVDADDRPDLDQLEELSREVSAEFDARETSGALRFGPGYTFEVTTPGLDTPLTQLRHFRRNVGRLVSVGGEAARVAAVEQEDDTVWLVLDGEGKKAAPRVEPRGLASVAGALVEVEFSEPPADQRELVGLDPEKYRALHAQKDDK